MPFVETAAFTADYKPMLLGSYLDGRENKEFYPNTDKGRRDAMLDFGSRISSIKTNPDTVVTVISDKYSIEYKLTYANGVTAYIIYCH